MYKPIGHRVDIFYSRIRQEEARQRHHYFYNVTTEITQSIEVDQANIWATETYAFAYTGIMISFLVIASARSAVFFKICATISQNLHDTMFSKLTSTTMNFFDSNPIGRIMNRFTKDLGSIDELFPRTIFIALQTNLRMLGVILVTVYTDPKLSVVILALGALFMLVRKIYLKSSTSIQRLEGISKYG